MLLLGYDIGSSSVKASLVDAVSGQCVASAFYPKQEAPILSHRAGWAEQDPAMWWENLRLATAEILDKCPMTDAKHQIAAVGISYQMHGLVCVDKDLQVLRPAIIWCDSRAVLYGEAAKEALGEDYCLEHMLNAPGNFTAAKLAWVKANEPELFARIHKIMLPGDYIAMRLTGSARTTVSGLSEGILWDFKAGTPAYRLLEHYHIDSSVLCEVVPTFGVQGCVTDEAATLLRIPAGIPVSYRAGDQPNNALSLGVLQAGEIASTAGTSGVVYGVIDQVAYDPQSRVNPFAHVNYSVSDPRLGVLLCINGTGILNSWIHHHIAPDLTYPQMNEEAAKAPIGAGGLSVLPFGNGAERMLCNEERGCSIHGLSFTQHTRAHILRAAQEGIVFSFMYGIEIMQSMGLKVNTIHAGNANMFLSPIFRDTLAGVSGATILLHDTDGAAGAAKGAGIGAGIYATAEEAFSTLQTLQTVRPQHTDEYRAAYERWKKLLTQKSYN
ncbi:MAG: xylulokinase [Paludibacteraceae bacterium]